MNNTQGLPLFDKGEEPDGFVTLSALTAMRRQLAEGQTPVATLRYGKSSDRTSLYRASAAVPLPPRSVKERARSAAARVHPWECSVCGVDAGEPLTQPGSYGMCPHCAVERVLESLRAHRPEARRRASEAAAAILADPDTLVVDVARIAVKQPSELTIHKREAVRAVAVIGRGQAEPHWLHVVPQEKPDRVRDLPAGVAPGSWPYAPTVDVDDRFRGIAIGRVAYQISDVLVGRRLVAWSDDPVRTLLEDLRHAAVGYRWTDDDDWRVQGGKRQQGVRLGDQVAGLYAPWVGAVDARRPAYGHTGYGYARQHPPRLDPGDRVVWLLEQLERMAASPERGTAR